jgi:hypothetical protein
MHTGPAPRLDTLSLPPQAAARAYPNFAAVTARYPDAWRFVGETQPLEAGDVDAFVAACTDLPSNWTQIKLFHNGTEVTVFASTGEL